MENRLPLLFESADRFFREGNFLESLFCYRDILQDRNASEKSLEFAYGGAGETLMNLGLFKEAAAYLKEAIKFNDEDYNYHYLLADCYLKILKPKEAQSHLRRSLDLRPNHPELLRCLGWSYILQKQDREGIKLLKKSLTLEENNLHTLCDLAIAYMNLHHHRESQVFIERAKKISPDDPLVLDIESANRHFGTIHKKLGKISKTKNRSGKSQSPTVEPTQKPLPDRLRQ